MKCTRLTVHQPQTREIVWDAFKRITYWKSSVTHASPLPTPFQCLLLLSLGQWPSLGGNRLIFQPFLFNLYQFTSSILHETAIVQRIFMQFLFRCLPPPPPKKNLRDIIDFS